MTLNEAIRDAAEKLARAGVTNARLDAEVLLAHTVNKDRVWVITHINDLLENGMARLFEDTINRRARREPLQYITGKQEFWGLEFNVSPNVLIPRPETELVVESAIELLKGTEQQAVIIDLCTGSGCIAVSLANELRSSRIFATDMSEQALITARENARKHGVGEQIRFFQGDLFAPLEELDLAGRVNCITANPPYIESGDLSTLQPEVRDYEPELALIAGTKGTEIQQRIIERAPEFLKQQGTLIMEMGLGQAQKLRWMIDSTGAYAASKILKDLAGIDRVIVARKR